jgi:hypothetical protein
MEYIFGAGVLLGVWLGGMDKRKKVKDLTLEVAALKHSALSAPATGELSHHGASATSELIVVPSVTTESAAHLATQAGTVTTNAPTLPALSIAPRKQTDSVEVMLYFGVFLLFVSLLGLGFGQTWNATLRTLLFIILTAASYIAGLVISRTKKYSEVGVAFLALGLGMAPVLGFVAKRNDFWNPSAGLLWLSMSVLSLLMFVIATTYTKKSIMGYMSLLVGLSSFLATFYQFGNIPTYLLANMSIAYSLIIYLLSKSLSGAIYSSEKELNDSSKSLLVVSTIVGLMNFGDGAWGDSAVTLLASGVALTVMTLLSAKSPRASSPNYAFEVIGSYILVMSGLICLVLSFGQENFTEFASAALVFSSMVTLTLIYAVKRVGLWRNFHTYNLTSSLGGYLFVSLGLCLWAALSVSKIAGLAVATLATLAFCINYLLDRSWQLAGVSGAVGVLTLPLLAYNVQAQDTGTEVHIFYFYLVAAVLVTTVYLSALISGKVRRSGLSYITTIATIGAMILSNFPTHENIVSILAGVAAVTLLCAMGYVAKQPELKWFARAVFYAYSLVIYGEADGQYFGLVLALVALFDYAASRTIRTALGKVTLDNQDSFAAFAAAASGAIISVGISEDTFGYATSTSLIICAVIMALESVRTWKFNKPDKFYYAEVAGGLVVSSVLWLIYKPAPETPIYVYSTAYAFYLAICTRFNKITLPKVDWLPMTLITLAVFTYGLGYDAIYNKNVAISWALLISQIMIMFYGVLVKEKIIIYWGLTVATLSVLYQLRDYRDILLGVLGLAVIGLAGYLVYRREHHDILPRKD